MHLEWTDSNPPLGCDVVFLLVPSPTIAIANMWQARWFPQGSCGFLVMDSQPLHFQLHSSPTSNTSTQAGFQRGTGETFSTSWHCDTRKLEKTLLQYGPTGLFLVHPLEVHLHVPYGRRMQSQKNGRYRRLTRDRPSLTGTAAILSYYAHAATVGLRSGLDPCAS